MYTSRQDPSSVRDVYHSRPHKRLSSHPQSACQHDEQRPIAAQHARHHNTGKRSPSRTLMESSLAPWLRNTSCFASRLTCRVSADFAAAKLNLRCLFLSFRQAAKTLQDHTKVSNDAVRNITTEQACVRAAPEGQQKVSKSACRARQCHGRRLRSSPTPNALCQPGPRSVSSAYKSPVTLAPRRSTCAKTRRSA